MFGPTPSEWPVAGVYVAPALVLALVAFVAAWIVTQILNRLRLARFFWNPPLAFLAIWVLCGAVLGLFVLAP